MQPPWLRRSEANPSSPTTKELTSFDVGSFVLQTDSKGGSWQQSSGLLQPPWPGRSRANPSSPTMKDQSAWIGLFCISVAITGFERQLLATVRWTAATAVARPQPGESVPSFFAQTAAGKTPTAVSIKIPFAASPYPFPEPLPSGGPGRPSGGRILSNCRGALPRRLRRFLGPGSRPGPQRGRRSP